MGAEIVQADGRSAQMVQVGTSSTTDYGHLRTSDEPASLFSDSFESLDTTNRWTTKTSTGTATVASGNLTVASSTTASAYGGLFTKAAFAPTGLNFIVGGIVVIIPTVALTNSVRCWGFGTLPATPTLAIPVTDGVFFMLDGTGHLYGKVFAAGVEVGSVDLAAYNPTAGLPAGYAIQYRADKTTFFINTAAIPVGSVQVVAPAVEQLPFFAISIAGATPPASSATMICRAAGVGETGKNGQSIRDATYPWRGATVSSDGAIIHRDFEKNSRTYSAVANVTAAAAATDLVTITGSATTTVYVTRVTISGTQTTAGLVDVVLLTRSTANTGGTSGAVTAVAHDTTDAAAAATVLAYTANPTPGTLVGNIRRRYVPVDAPASVVGTEVVTFDFGDKGRPITLRGIAQVLAVNLNGATVTGGVFDVEIEWYEV
jgi:hypothetical protein